MCFLCLKLHGLRFSSMKKRSNPSVELTNCSKLQSAAHLELQGHPREVNKTSPGGFF